MTAETAKPKKQVIHSPLTSFRKRANCQTCELHDACLSDKTIETRCILALIADSIHNAMRLEIMKGLHL